MLGQVWSVSLQGVEGVPIRVEAQVTKGIPSLFIVGLPRGAVREGRDRIQSALRTLPGDSDALKVTINLAPADLMKEGSGLDLAMAVSLLAGAGLLPADRLPGMAFLGELGLDGRVHPVRGVLPLALGCARAGLRTLVVPEANLSEAATLRGTMELLGAHSLADVQRFLRGEGELRRPGPAPDPSPRISEDDGGVDLAWIRGQAQAKRALEIAAAGAHSLLLAGPPGSGKTLLGRALPGLLPDLDADAALEVTAIHSVAGLLPPGSGLVKRPPFRAPHHGASQGALVGGGTPLRPGEVTLAHRGILFLDELTTWQRSVLDALREPMETGVVDVVRTSQRARFPARFQLMAAMNPCGCGYLGTLGSTCVCDPSLVRRYQDRVSGPLLDRIDLHLRLVPPPPELLLDGRSEEPSERARARVAEAALRRRARAVLPGTRKARAFLARGARHLGLSGRGTMRMMSVARTIALLDGRDRVEEDHVAEALQFRGL